MNIAINGFGRIGRLALRVALLNYPDANIVAVNTSGSMDMHGWAMLFQYDSAYGKFPQQISVKQGRENEIGRLVVDNTEIPFLAFSEPEQIPWDAYHVDIVLESTGAFTKRVDAEKHLKPGVRQIIISAPAKGGDVPLLMLKINEEQFKGQAVVSNCSCTTYSAAPVIKTIVDTFGIMKGNLTTIHAYTSDQRLLDGSHPKDVRRARAAGHNIIPTSSGAAKALAEVIPELKGKFTASAYRVPIITGSLSDITVLLSRNVTAEEVNNAFTKDANERFNGIMEVTSDPIVSSDIIGNSASAIVDLSLTEVVDGNLLRVASWYDNEWSYACRLIEMALI